MALDVIGLGLANSYTDEEVAGGGAIKGKNAVVDDISKSGKKNTVRFKWTLDNGTVLTGDMEVLDGEDGADGAPGQPGKDGAQGAPGKGIKSIAQVPGESKIIITYDDNTTSEPIDIPTVAGKDGKDGKDGTDGTNGTNGQDGVSPTIEVKTSTGSTYILTITDAEGSTDTPNLKGADGQDGRNGTDGIGVPSGGTAGQVLKKKSGTDYDTEWGAASTGSGLPSGGVAGQVLAKKSATDYDAEWIDTGDGGFGSIIELKDVTDYIGYTAILSKGGTQISSRTITTDPFVMYCSEVGVIDISIVEHAGDTPVFTGKIAIKYYSKYEVSAIQVLYGFRIAKAESDPSTRVTYLEDAVGITPAAMDYVNDEFDYGGWEDAFFMPKPCMLKYDGSVDYYLNPNDYSKKADGTASDYQNTLYEGNVMIEFPKIWVKYTEDTNYQYVYIANYKIDENTYCYANLDANGNEMEHFYVSAYECCSISNKLRSLSNQTPANSNTCSEEIALARANEVDSSDQQWYIAQWCDRAVINDLLILISKSTDTQTAFGMGHDRGGTSASALIDTGTLDDKGLFFGDESGAHAVKVFGIENYWGNTGKRVAGLLASGKHLYAKMTWSQADGSTVTGYETSDVSNYMDYGKTLSGTSSGGYISETYASKLGILPVVASGTLSTYECDAIWYTTGSGYAVVGGGCNAADKAGAFCLDVSEGPSAAYWVSGVFMSCKPLEDVS